MSHPRAFVVDYAHDIVQREHDRQAVFATDEDYAFYLRNLTERRTLLGVSVFAYYCLMTNHIHLVMQPERRS